MAVIFSTGIISFTGIGTGSAYADKDAIGTVATSVTVPQSGTIETAVYYDLDDEGLEVDLWLFTAAPADQTDNSAFALTDAELQTVIDVIPFTTFSDAANGQVSFQHARGASYISKGGTIYAQLQARGALNIAAANLPVVELRILPH